MGAIGRGLHEGRLLGGGGTCLLGLGGGGGGPAESAPRAPSSMATMTLGTTTTDGCVREGVRPARSRQRLQSSVSNSGLS